MNTSYNTNANLPTQASQRIENDPVLTNMGRTSGLIFGCAMMGAIISCSQLPASQNEKSRFSDPDNLKFVFYASMIGAAIGLISGISVGLIECYSKRNHEQNN